MKNPAGLKFGKILVLEGDTGARSTGGYVLWKGQCDCGTVRMFYSTTLKNGKVKSCGCQAYATNSLKETTHGLSRGSGNSIYLIWQGIKNRCLNKNSFAYKDYGGRGIKVCERWLNSFENFYDDMIEGYAKGLTLERIDVNGNYEKLNCKWITRAEQANNRRTTIYIDHPFYGKITIKRAASIVGICWQAMYTRIKHWPEERWFEEPK